MAQGSPETATDSCFSTEQLRGVLAHLYDDAYLEERTALVARFPDLPDVPFAKSRALRMWILDALESLRPPPGTPRSAPAWRSYDILRARYVESRPVAEVMKRVALGRAHYFKEQRAALGLLMSFLCRGSSEDVGSRSPWRPRSSSQVLLQDEIGRVSGEEQTEEVCLQEMVQNVVEIVTSLPSTKDVQILFRSDADECLIRTHRVLLRQLLIHVLSNTVRRVAEGKVLLRLCTPDNCAELAVIARTLTSPHEWLLDRTSEQLCAALGISMRHQMHGDETTIRISVSPRSKRLALLIDNDRDLGLLFSRYLAGYDWELLATQDADEGLRMAAQLRPQVIILDVIMPDQDGWEVLARIRDDVRTRDIGIAVCSVLEEPGLALALGADMFLPKPVDQLTLVNAVQKLVSHGSTSQQR